MIARDDRAIITEFRAKRKEALLSSSRSIGHLSCVLLIKRIRDCHCDEDKEDASGCSCKKERMPITLMQRCDWTPVWSSSKVSRDRTAVATGHALVGVGWREQGKDLF